MCETITAPSKAEISPELREYVNPLTGEITADIVGYLEPFAKLHKKSGQKAQDLPIIALQGCLNGFVLGECTNGHRRAKAIYCGKEWCYECGSHNSPVHQRRKARWFDDLMTFDSIGYLVITVPKQVRNDFLDKAVLSAYTLAIKRKLSEGMGYDKGFTRWHWLGNCKKCHGKPFPNGCSTCLNTGAGREYNPHLNIFIEEGHLTGDKFNKVVGELKVFCQKWIKNNLFVDVPDPVTVYYHYATKREKKIHLLTYVTRATLRHCNTEADIQKTVFRFRTSNRWGVFPKIKPSNPLNALEKGICDCCGEKMHYTGFTALKHFPFHRDEMLPLDAGYVMLPDVKYEKPPPKPPEFKLLSYVSN